MAKKSADIQSMSSVDEFQDLFLEDIPTPPKVSDDFKAPQKLLQHLSMTNILTLLSTVAIK